MKKADEKVRKVLRRYGETIRIGLELWLYKLKREGTDEARGMCPFKFVGDTYSPDSPGYPQCFLCKYFFPREDIKLGCPCSGYYSIDYIERVGKYLLNLITKEALGK